MQFGKCDRSIVMEEVNTKLSSLIKKNDDTIVIESTFLRATVSRLEPAGTNVSEARKALSRYPRPSMFFDKVMGLTMLVKDKTFIIKSQSDASL